MDTKRIHVEIHDNSCEYIWLVYRMDPFGHQVILAKGKADNSDQAFAAARLARKEIEEKEAANN